MSSLTNWFTGKKKKRSTAREEASSSRGGDASGGDPDLDEDYQIFLALCQAILADYRRTGKLIYNPHDASERNVVTILIAQGEVVGDPEVVEYLGRA